MMVVEKAECRGIDVFELWCWRRLLIVSWAARRSNQFSTKGNQLWIILIGRTDAEAEAPILWLPDANSRLMEKTLMLGKIEGRKKRGQQRMRWLDSVTNVVDMNLGKSGRWWGTGRPGIMQFMGLWRPNNRKDSSKCVVIFIKIT